MIRIEYYGPKEGKHTVSPTGMLIGKDYLWSDTDTGVAFIKSWLLKNCPVCYVVIIHDLETDTRKVLCSFARWYLTEPNWWPSEVKFRPGV